MQENKLIYVECFILPRQGHNKKNIDCVSCINGN